MVSGSGSEGVPFISADAPVEVGGTVVVAVVGTVVCSPGVLVVGSVVGTVVTAVSTVIVGSVEGAAVGTVVSVGGGQM